MTCYLECLAGCPDPGDPTTHTAKSGHTVLAADLQPASDRDLILTAIRRATQAHGDVISRNEIAAHLNRDQIQDPHHIGQTVTALIREGALVKLDWNAVSDDVAGGNAGRPVQRYRVRLERIGVAA